MITIAASMLAEAVKEFGRPAMPGETPGKNRVFRALGDGHHILGAFCFRNEENAQAACQKANDSLGWNLSVEKLRMPQKTVRA